MWLAAHTDRKAPTLTWVNIRFASDIDTVCGSTDDQVVLSFTSSEPLKTGTVRVTINGVTVTAVSTGVNTWSAVYGVINTTADGKVTFSIAFSDLVGNAGEPVTRTTDGSAIGVGMWVQ